VTAEGTNGHDSIAAALTPHFLPLGRGFDPNRAAKRGRGPLTPAVSRTASHGDGEPLDIESSRAR